MQVQKLLQAKPKPKPFRNEEIVIEFENLNPDDSGSEGGVEDDVVQSSDEDKIQDGSSVQQSEDERDITDAAPVALLSCEISPDGTKWEIVEDSLSSLLSQNSLRILSGPTCYAFRNISEQSVYSAFPLIISDEFVSVVNRCIEIEAQDGKPGWTVSKDEILTLFALLYVRGMLGLGKMPCPPRRGERRLTVGLLQLGMTIHGGRSREPEA